MTALGPMLATLMTMSPGHAPLDCEVDSLGVTIRLGDRVEFFVELPRVCELDAPEETDAAQSGDVSELLEAVLASGDAAGDPESQSEPQANVAVTAEDESAATEVADAGATEEEVTLEQIAELDEQQDYEAAPDPSSETASTEEATASTQDEDGADEEPPVASDSAETQEVAPAPADEASTDTESVTGPAGLGLVSNDRTLWLDRFDRVRDEVRDAFRSLLP